MMAEYHDEMEDNHWMASLRAPVWNGWSSLSGRSYVGSMPLVDEVISTEDYQTGSTVLDSTSNRTICEDLEVRWGNGVNGLKGKVSLLGW